MITEQQYFEAVMLKDKYLKLHLEQCEIIAEFERQSAAQSEQPRLELIQRRLPIIIKEFGLKEKTRRQDVRILRQALYYWLKFNTRMSLAKIGKVCYNQDHATVLNACKKIQGYIDVNDKDILELCRLIWDRLDDLKRPRK